jgi:hypothetical protein
VPKLLSQEQQQLCLEVAQDNLECANRHPEILKSAITGDESWMYRYDSETKVQSHNGSIQYPHGPKKQDKFGTM